MVKKIVAIFFLLIYSLTSVGTTIHAHYCMGEYMGSSLFHSKENKCEKCGMTKAKSKGCCKDEQKYVSLKSEHNQTKVSAVITNFFAEAPVPFLITYNIVAVTYPTTTASTIPHPPSLIHKQRLHLLNCVFRI
ncbi:MAG: HYC_CC_PP family protein [Chitinophagaceae bacterium]